jgi:hypothetical protein
MDDTTILFVVVIIATIIIAIRLASTTARDTRTGGSDQRKTTHRSDLSDSGSGNHGTGYTYGEGFEGIDKVIKKIFPNLSRGARFIISEIIIFILMAVGFVALIYFLIS